MRILTLAVRALKENYRDPLALGFLLGFPAVFMFIFVLIFGGDVVPNFEIGVVDKDGTQLSQVFIDDVLSDMEVLTPTKYESNEEALAAFEDVLRQDAGHIDATYGKGLVLKGLDRTGEAAAAFHRVLELLDNIREDMPGRATILERMSANQINWLTGEVIEFKRVIGD